MNKRRRARETRRTCILNQQSGETSGYYEAFCELDEAILTSLGVLVWNYNGVM